MEHAGDAAVVNFFSSFLSTYTSFSKVWTPDHLRYGLMSSIVNAVHCDGDFMKYNMLDRFKSDLKTECGPICTTLMNQFGGPVETVFRVNPMDHTQVVVFASNATAGIPITGVGTYPTKLFVAFRGTQAFDVINNRRNFNFVFWPVTLCTDCEAHKGFWRNFISLRPEISTLIDELGGKLAAIDGASTTFLTTGMSMGAPLASLTAYHLSNLGHTPMGVVTFGSPRVGNLKLAESIAGSFSESGVGTIGMAYMRDPVPHVPPRVLGYRSAQGLLFHISMDPAANILTQGMGEEIDLDSYIRYSNSYTSTTNNGWQGDKEFAGSTYTFKLSDHLAYFASMRVEMYSCGMMSEDFIKNDKATELFFM
jgi:hypothetical protein